MAKEQDEERLHRELVNVIRRMRKVRLNAMSQNIIYTEYQALDQINRYGKEHPDSQGIYVSKLARDLRIAPPSASRLLKTMEGKGLIIRTVDKGSRRNTFVSLTSEGSRTLAQATKNMEEVKLRLIRRMGHEDITKLIELWNKLAEIMEDETGAAGCGETECEFRHQNEEAENTFHYYNKEAEEDS